MPSGKSSRRNLPFLETTDAPKYHEWGQLLAAALDNDVEGGQGILSARTNASIRGRVYMVQGDATAANNGILWWDTSATWVALQPRIADGQVYTTGASLASGAPVTPNASRATQVIFICRSMSSFTLTVGAVTPVSLVAPSAFFTLTFIVPAGVSFTASWTLSSMPGGVEVTYLPL